MTRSCVHAPAARPLRDPITSLPQFLLGDARPQQILAPRRALVRREEVQNPAFAVVQTPTSLIYGVNGRVRQQIDLLEFWSHTLDIRDQEFPLRPVVGPMRKCSERTSVILVGHNPRIRDQFLEAACGVHRLGPNGPKIDKETTQRLLSWRRVASTA